MPSSSLLQGLKGRRFCDSLMYYIVSCKEWKPNLPDLSCKEKMMLKYMGISQFLGRLEKSDSEQVGTKESSAGMITPRVQHRPAGRTCSPYPASPPPELESLPGHSCCCPQRAPPYLGLQLGSRNSKLNSPDHCI